MSGIFAKLNRIEFVVTNSCSGKCRHCSEGGRLTGNARLSGELCARVVREMCENYKIESLMTFGGEPLLCPETVLAIHRTAREMGIPRRDLITNGFFSRDCDRIREVALGLAEAGVTKILLSVDAFHQEFIPTEPVKIFASEALRAGLTIKTHPAWLGGCEAENPWNHRTHELLDEFAELGLSPSDGNTVFPEGNAKIHLAEYFPEGVTHENPYADDPRDIRCFSVDADGSVLGGSIYESSPHEILAAYEKSLEGRKL